MKKLCSVICLILVLMSMVLPVRAAETETVEDSVTIPEDVLACLDAENIESVFCVYVFQTGQFLSYRYEDFVRYGDVDSVLVNSAEPKMRRYYFVKNKDGETGVYFYDGENWKQRSTESDDWYRAQVEQGKNAIQAIHAGIIVENLYYLVYPGWAAIYYKTNFGDYVYVLSESGEYLMAREPFLALQEELYELSVKFRDWRDMDNGPYQVKFEQIKADLSPYRITSPDFDPYAPLQTSNSPGKWIAISAAVLLLVLMIGRLLIRSHEKYRITKHKWINEF